LSKGTIRSAAFDLNGEWSPWYTLHKTYAGLRDAETVLVEGEGAQNTARWEDYTQTAMDPTDDCTIWYVGDYIKKDATAYSSRIGAFRLPGCKAR
jgi:hypothetical protein